MIKWLAPMDSNEPFIPFLALQANYGRKDKECVAAIKKIYVELKVEEKFKEYEAQTYKVSWWRASLCPLISWSELCCSLCLIVWSSSALSEPLLSH